MKNGTHVEWDETGEKVIEGKFKEGILISKKQIIKGS